jgi:hypothetical protein
VAEDLLEDFGVLALLQHVRGSASAVGCGAHVLVALSKQTDEQGSRTAARDE